MTEQLAPMHITYQGFDRKACEVEVDGLWHDAEIRGWGRDEGGAWTAAVMWSTGPGQGNRLGRFAEERVRPVDEPTADGG